MQYALIITKGKSKELYKLYDNIEQAERKLKKTFIENGRILEIPEISSGLRLYKSNNEYYGTIIKETKSLWLINNTDFPEPISNPIIKENITNWFIKGIFLDGIEEFDENYTMNFYHNEDDNIEEFMDEFEDIIAID